VGVAEQYRRHGLTGSIDGTSANTQMNTDARKLRKRSRIVIGVSTIYFRPTR
jgi:hypothetical protein